MVAPGRAQVDEAHAVVLEPGARRRRRWSPARVALLVFSGVCLYLLAPSIREVFAAWDRLGRVHPVWMVPAVLCAIGSYACIWWVQAIALGTRDWFSVITTELAGNAFNRITPGGGATGTALQANMLRAAGFDGAHAGTALAVQSALGTAALVALPLFSIPFVIAGTQIPSGLLPAVWIGIPVFVVMLAFGIAVFVVDAPLCWLGRVVAAAQRVLHKDRDDLRDLGDRLLRSRDAIFQSVAPKWRRAVAASVLRWLFEYGVLVSALYGLGVRPDPALVLLAFTIASVLGLMPFTPGGLGFVEAGLTATLTLAGVPVGAALVATLVYRLLTFWLPLPIGGVAAAIFRRRHPKARISGDMRHSRGLLQVGRGNDSP